MEFSIHSSPLPISLSPCLFVHVYMHLWRLLPSATPLFPGAGLLCCSVKQLPCPALQLRKDAGATASVSTSKDSYFTVMTLFAGGSRGFNGYTLAVCLGRPGAMFPQKPEQRLCLSASGFIPLGAPGGEDMEGPSPVRA